MIPLDLTLETDKVLLRPIEDNDYESFFALSSADEKMWKYFSLNLADPVQLKKWMQLASTDKAANTRRPFTIIDKASGTIAGSMSMGNISLHDLRLEIGWSWLGTAFRGTDINRHSKFAMMRYAFDELKFERVEFKTDVENARARSGLEKIGGVQEGILRSHMTMWNNRRRDSIIYSVIKKEWPLRRHSIFLDIQ